jgi:TetR/AcrR family acrAB operon transcriptional repressor
MSVLPIPRIVSPCIRSLAVAGNSELAQEPGGNYPLSPGMSPVKVQRKKNCERSEETRQKILDAAEHVFYEKGVDTSTIEDISRRAYVTRGAFYWHFRDKTDVLHAILQNVRFPIEEVSPGSTFSESCARIKDAFLTTLQSDHLLRVSRILIETPYHEDAESPVNQRLAAIRGSLMDYFEQTLRQAQSKGELHESVAERDIPGLATSCRALLTGMLMELLLVPNQTEFPFDIDKCLTDFFKRMSHNQ